eukprot:GILK01002982.1.p1 GENE.GILK01002982.1~~GILK01002982.1.p1  ORF type:complete len:101 (-),score=21.02 GILK01002982.1:74-376(-)
MSLLRRGVGSLISSRGAMQRTVAGGSQGFKDREEAAEKLFFNKQEEELLQKLLHKVKSETSKASGPAGKAEEDSLKAVFQKHGVSTTTPFFKDVLQWKRS